MDEPPICKKCGDEYFLKDGYEVTDYCDPCAQELVPELLEKLRHLEVRANCRLIAAAPELYAALEALLLRLYITAEIRDGDKELRAQAEAALKKAKGL
jgi:hypothetical protein